MPKIPKILDDLMREFYKINPNINVELALSEELLNPKLWGIEGHEDKKIETFETAFGNIKLKQFTLN